MRLKIELIWLRCSDGGDDVVDVLEGSIGMDNVVGVVEVVVVVALVMMI